MSSNWEWVREIQDKEGRGYLKVVTAWTAYPTHVINAVTVELHN